jgi:uncharacterized protein YjgD (DUF1641 family)
MGDLNMNKAVRIDLADAADAIEHLLELLPKMSLQDKIDTCARLRGATKVIDQIDKAVKDEIKAMLNEQDGSLLGRLYKAVLKYSEITRLNQATLKVERPKIYEQYCDTTMQARVTFEPR